MAPAKKALIAVGVFLGAWFAGVVGYFVVLVAGAAMAESSVGRAETAMVVIIGLTVLGYLGLTLAVAWALRRAGLQGAGRWAAVALFLLAGLGTSAVLAFTTAVVLNR